MPTGYWYLKLNIHLLRDARFNDRLTEARKWRYMQLYMLAAALRADGAFIRSGQQMTIEDIAWELHIPNIGDLESDIQSLKEIGLISENGHGPYLTRYHDEQGARDDATRKRDQRNRERSEEMSQIGHMPVTPCDTESESESESESEIESESEVINKSQSVPQNAAPAQTTDDRTRTLTELLKLCGIPKTGKDRGEVIHIHADIISDLTIIRDDILAELSRSYSRKGNKPGDVKAPGMCAGLNLAKGERAPAEWYTSTKWTRHLPHGLTTKLGLVNSETNTDDENLVVSDYANNDNRGSAVEKKVAEFLKVGGDK